MTGRRDEHGFTLVELAVVVLIMGIVSVVLFDFLDSTTNVTARATSSVVKENEARLALRELTADIRAANVISATYPTNSACTTGGSFPTGYPSCVTFEIKRSVDSAQACPKSVVTYGLVGTSVKKTRIDYAANCTTITRSVTGRTVIDGVVNGASTPLFRYFDGTGAQVASTTSTAGYIAASSIKTTLLLQYKTRSPNLLIDSTVALRNNR